MFLYSCFFSYLNPKFASDKKHLFWIVCMYLHLFTFIKRFGYLLLRKVPRSHASIFEPVNTAPSENTPISGLANNFYFYYEKLLLSSAPYCRIAYDHSRADWHRPCDHFRHVPWEDIF